MARTSHRSIERARDARSPPRVTGGISGSVLLTQSADARGRHRGRAHPQLRIDETGPSSGTRRLAPPKTRAAQMVKPPQEFAAGHRPPPGIARGLPRTPSFMGWEEPVSALDVSVQAQ